MKPEEIDAWLARSLDDRRFSRSERQALSEFAASLGSSIDRESIRRSAFEVARAALVSRTISPSSSGWSRSPGPCARLARPPTVRLWRRRFSARVMIV